MGILWFLGAVIQCALLVYLWRAGKQVILRQTPAAPPLDQWVVRSGMTKAALPKVAMLIPAAGAHPAMPEALRSLLQQDYPQLLPVIITAEENDPATTLAKSLQKEFPHLQHVLAGPAHNCGQKNHNLLQGIAAVGSNADIYVFCDSTHVAEADFVRQLVWPIACGESAFSTGYHRVVAKDTQPVTLAYQICVLLMRLLQAVSVFTQPWGGAMSISRQAFERHKIGYFWSTNVVDDCSLASLLLKEKLHVRLCPHAILTTTAGDHNMDTWRAWLDRQVLFLKFCIPSQWWLLGLLAIVMTIPPVVSLLAILASVTGMMPPHAAWLTLAAIAHLAVLLWAGLGWRSLTEQEPAPTVQWFWGFGLASAMFARVYVATLQAQSIDWHGFRYIVGKNGHVEKKIRL